MFSFLSKDKSGGIDKKTLKKINNAVCHFLEVREVQNFKVYTMDYENNPVVLIQAVPQKKLRFSNILEIQIKRYLEEKLGLQIPAVFWRFKVDSSNEPGPEQVDYDYEEQPESQQETPATIALLESDRHPGKTEASQPEGLSIDNGEHYDVRHLARKGMEIEEISMGEFDEFLKGSPSEEPK